MNKPMKKLEPTQLERPRFRRRVMAAAAAALLLSLSPIFATGGEPSAATTHIVKAIQELERELKSRAEDEHKKKALGLLVRARGEILQSESAAAAAPGTR